MKSQAKNLWMHVNCKTHDNNWYEQAHKDKQELLEFVNNQDKKLKAKKPAIVRPKSTRKPLVKDASWRQHRTNSERIRRANKRKTDVQWWEKTKQYQKDYYAKNPTPQIESSKKWNSENKERKNANNRASYNRHKIEICKRNKLKRLQKRKQKNG